MKLAVSTQRAVAHHIASSNLSNRHIADIYNISPGTVSKLRLKLKQSGRAWEDLAILNDHDFRVQLGTISKHNRSDALIHPNYAQIYQEMQTRDMTLKLLHIEYLAQMQDAPEKTISYSTFAHSYTAWLRRQRISMRQTHKVGEKMFVDFCGKTMPITHAQTGEITKAQIFVAVLGGSRYTFVYAVPSQKQNDWLSCHIEAFDYFQGVPKQIVPDNLKSAVIQHRRDSILLNQSYVNLAEHYHCVISPARSRKPKDKSLAEVTVQIVQRWILAALRKRAFFSIEDLNKEISKRLEELNNKHTKNFPKNRKELFLEMEKSALQPLPDTPYLLNQWRYNVKVPNDYHVEYDKHFYSVPYHYIGQLVDIRASQHIIEILIQNYRVASHVRRFDAGMSTHQEHQPIEHQKQAQNEPDALQIWAKRLGLYAQEWVHRNLQHRKDFANGLKSVRRLRAWLREAQSYDDLEHACQFALQYEILGFKNLLDIIKNKSHIRKIETTNKEAISHSNIRGANYYK